MPKVKMLIKISGERNGSEWPEIGDTVDVPKDEAESLVSNGYAEKVAAKKKAEGGGDHQRVLHPRRDADPVGTRINRHC